MTSIKKDKRKLKNYILANHSQDVIQGTLVNGIEPLDKHYLGSFVDGDGSIYIGTSSKDAETGTTYYMASVSISQCAYEVLIRIQQIYGGDIYHDREATETTRDQYSLQLIGIRAQKIINDLREGCIVKYMNACLVDEFIHTTDQARKLEIRELCQKNNQNKMEIAEIPYDRMCDAYIAGLFDAEGCIIIRNKENTNIGGSITIAQASNHTLLRKIRKYLGYGRVVDNVHWAIYNKPNRVDFLKRVMPYLIVKRVQANALMAILNDDLSVAEYREQKQIIHDDKHSIRKLDEEERIRLNEQSKQVFTEAKDAVNTEMHQHINNIREINRVIKISGENHHMHGKSLPEEHAMNIAEAKLKHKRGKITDEMIHQIRELHAAGHAQVAIAEKFGVSRSAIGKVINDKRHATTDASAAKIARANRERKEQIAREKAEHRSDYEQHVINKSAISKRKNRDPAKVVEVLRLKGQYTSTEVADKYAEHGFTVDSIKNIWRKTTYLKPDEFANLDISYDDYITLVKTPISAEQKHILKNRAIALRAVEKRIKKGITFDVVMDIFAMREDNSFVEIASAVSDKYDITIASYTVADILKGRSNNLREFEFEGRDITYQEYLDMIVA